MVIYHEIVPFITVELGHTCTISNFKSNYFCSWLGPTDQRLAKLVKMRKSTGMGRTQTQFGYEWYGILHLKPFTDYKCYFNAVIRYHSISGVTTDFWLPFRTITVPQITWTCSWFLVRRILCIWRNNDNSSNWNQHIFKWPLYNCLPSFVVRIAGKFSRKLRWWSAIIPLSTRT